MRFSASRLRTWMECQLAAKYRYEDNLPRKNNAKAVFGTFVHAALEHYYNSRGDIEGAIKIFTYRWADPQRAGHPIDVWPRYTSFGGLMSKGKEIIRAVHASHRWQDFTVIGTEIPFLVTMGRHEINGYIDLLGIEKSGTGTELLKIIDFKTNSKNPSIPQLALDVQLTVYDYAVRQKEFWTGVPGDPVYIGVDNGEWLWETVGKTMTHRCIWWGVWTGKQIDAGPRTELDYQRVYRVMDEIEKSINAGIAVPKIGEACTFCDYQVPCALEIPVAIKQASDPNDPNRWI